jgi:hypothetical protein
MKIIFDVRDEDDNLSLNGLSGYFDALKSLNFSDELWMTLTQKDDTFRGYDKFYRGVQIIIKEKKA